MVFTMCCTQTHGRCSPASQGDYSLNWFSCTGQVIKPGEHWTALKGGQVAAYEPGSFANSSKLRKSGCQERDQELWFACSDRLKSDSQSSYHPLHYLLHSPDGNCHAAAAETTEWLMKQLLECSSFQLGVLCLQFEFNLICFRRHSFICLAAEVISITRAGQTAWGP